MELLLVATLFGLGAVSASFITVIVERLHTGQSWVQGRSRCNSCATLLGARDLVPVLSWILSFGRCRSCSSRVPLQYALTELATGLLFVGAYLKLGLAMALVPFLVALLAILFTVLYDLRHMIVPEAGWMVLLGAGVAYHVLLGVPLPMLGVYVMAAGFIGLAFYLLYALSRGRAMGLGDAPVALSLSLLVGPQAIAGLLFSFWIGAVVGIAILVLRRGGPTMGIEIPFVPFLAAGYLLAYFTQWNPLGLV